MSSPTANDAAISTRLLTRVIIGLIAVWSLLAGTVLVAFHGASSGALGAGVADEAGQRLVGAHLLLLVPVYLLILWRIDRYQALVWLPFGGQLAVALVAGYSILTGETDFGDGILPVAVGSIFAGLLGFVWITEQRTVARQKLEQAEREQLETGRDASAPGQQA